MQRTFLLETEKKVYSPWCTYPALSYPRTQVLNLPFRFWGEPRYFIGMDALRRGWKTPNSSAENSSTHYTPHVVSSGCWFWALENFLKNYCNLNHTDRTIGGEILLYTGPAGGDCNDIGNLSIFVQWRLSYGRPEDTFALVWILFGGVIT